MWGIIEVDHFSVHVVTTQWSSSTPDSICRIPGEVRGNPNLFDIGRLFTLFREGIIGENLLRI